MQLLITMMSFAPFMATTSCPCVQNTISGVELSLDSCGYALMRSPVGHYVTS